MGRGQALLGAGDQNREPTVEGEKSHRTQDGQRDGLLQKGSRAMRMKKEHKVQRKGLLARFPAHTQLRALAKSALFYQPRVRLPVPFYMVFIAPEQMRAAGL